MNKNAIIVYDFETTGVDPYTCYPTQLGAVAVDPRTLDIYDGGTFDSLMQVTKEEMDAIPNQNKLNDALRITRKNREELYAAPGPKVVFTEFVAFCDRYNYNKKPSGAPILCGHNIINFDNIILQRLSEKYDFLSAENKPKFVSGRHFDTLTEWYWWTDNLPDFNRHGADYLREYTGMPTDNAHDAFFDVMSCYEWFRFFIMKRRRMTDPSLPTKNPRGNIFKNVFKPADV